MGINKFLLELDIYEDRSLNNTGAIAIVKALRENNRLIQLRLKPADLYPKGFLSGLILNPTKSYLDVLNDFYDLFSQEYNKTLECLNCEDLCADNAKKTNQIDAISSYLRRNKENNRRKKNCTLIILANMLDKQSFIAIIPKDALLIIAKNLLNSRTIQGDSCTIF